MAQRNTKRAIQSSVTIERVPLVWRLHREQNWTDEAWDAALAQEARTLLAQMKDFARGARFEPREAHLSLTIAANDLQRDLLLPGFLQALEREVASVEMRVVP